MWIPSYSPGAFVWAPPPAAARIAIEELRQARHKRQDSCHVFVCPRLMTTEWRRHLFRSADLIFVVKPIKGGLAWEARKEHRYRYNPVRRLPLPGRLLHGARRGRVRFPVWPLDGRPPLARFSSNE